METALAAALEGWRKLLGPANVLDAEQTDRYRAGTTKSRVVILGALLPTSCEQVVELTRIAQAHRIPLYPISTGKNWGYGDARPARDNCMIVDLSRLNRIVEFDAELGVVTLEPGVTQGQLHQYLEERGLPYMVPVTGAGPHTSILGNALERGYGITPQADHFQAVNWLEAVLPNGELYQTPLTGMGADTADKAFKWGIGPYLDGIFTQGAFGIVVKVTIGLVKKPAAAELFYFQLESDEEVELYATCLRQLLERLGSLVGGVNLMNAHRMLAMVGPYPGASDGVLSPEELQQSMRQYELPYWFGAGSLYGSGALKKGARAIVREAFEPIDTRIQFVNRGIMSTGRRLTRFLPASLTAGLQARLARAAAHLDVIEGKPSEVSLPLAYWRAGVTAPQADFDPARDGCGLLWYAPLVPMKEEMVGAAIEMVRRVCLAHEIEPLITLTSLSSRCFDLTVPILFAQHDRTQSDRAQQCYQQLFAEGRKLGIAPYRVGIESMSQLIEPSPYWRLVSALKATVDPQHIMAPGRYALDY